LRDAVFRGSTRFQASTAVVLFDFRQNSNFLLLIPDEGYSAGGARIFPFRIKDPLGYEHQPHILMEAGADKLYIASGPSVCRLDSTLECKAAFEPWSRILEIAVDRQRAVALVQERRRPIFRSSEPPGGGSDGYSLYDLATRDPIARFAADKPVFGLRLHHGRIYVAKAAESRESVTRSFFLDWALLGSSGMLSYGIDNLNGNVAWAQTYYLTGIVDALASGFMTGDAGEAAIRNRLRSETLALISLLGSDKGLRCSLFSADRQPVLHAVQSGKVLLYLKRYDEVTRVTSRRASFISRYARDVATLAGHVEVYSSMESRESRYRHLRWPKGSNFPYDGAVLPFNHQNLWAAGVLHRVKDYPAPQPSVRIARDAVQILLEEEALTGEGLNKRIAAEPSPKAYHWRYWWGKARSGWKPADGVSIHSPEFAGDQDSVALARYRTFDAIAVLVAMREGLVPRDAALVRLFRRAVENGELELFLLPHLEALGEKPSLSAAALARTLRFDSQPDLRNAVAAFTHLAARFE
jgi:hypothetical protein